jgi:hypothetical protein
MFYIILTVISTSQEIETGIAGQWIINAEVPTINDDDEDASIAQRVVAWIWEWFGVSLGFE